jgi:hypothetical protein
MKINSCEYSQMQRERIYRTKPWLKSTGAKTTKGKAKSKMNALKISPILNKLMKQSRELFKMQKELHSTLV